MKLPLKWLREFVTIDASVEEISRRLSVAGLEVENIERLAPNFEGVTIARVLDVQKHPNADRLNLCQVDSGAEKLSIVCGAPNVQAGMTAALARVGARLGKEPPLQAAIIRGISPKGCSARSASWDFPPSTRESYRCRSMRRSARRSRIFSASTKLSSMSRCSRIAAIASPSSGSRAKLRRCSTCG